MLEEGMLVPVCAEPGSLVVFTGNTWHCTYPKATEAARSHVVVAYCRNFVFPAQWDVQAKAWRRWLLTRNPYRRP